MTGKFRMTQPPPMLSGTLRPRYFASDANMLKLYPAHIADLAIQHWTPIRITRLAVEFLAAGQGARILDIGSGVGKFVLAGAYFKPDAEFYGVEQRKHLVAHAEAANQILGLGNVRFFHCNISEINFDSFDHFYFYNSFYENLHDTEKIDNTVECTPALYQTYYRMLYGKLAVMPRGTRLVTFHYIENRLPPSFRLVEEQEGALLKFWVKQ